MTNQNQVSDQSLANPAGLKRGIEKWDLVLMIVNSIIGAGIFGLPSKILGFIVCLCGITFPITGLIMWINRLRAERKLAKRK